MAPYSPGTVRRRSLLLLVALLPMLTYLGHWPQIRFDVPFAGGEWQVPFLSSLPSGQHDSEADTRRDHARHCHADSGSCMNGTAEATAFGAVLTAYVATLGTGGPSVSLPLTGDRSPQGRTLAPDSPPPRLPA